MFQIGLHTHVSVPPLHSSRNFRVRVPVITIFSLNGLSLRYKHKVIILTNFSRCSITVKKFKNDFSLCACWVSSSTLSLVSKNIDQ